MPEKKMSFYYSFIQYFPTRWLTLDHAFRQVVDQWLALSEYFLHYVPLKRHLKIVMSSEKYLKIVSYLKRKDMLTEFKFVGS